MKVLVIPNPVSPIGFREEDIGRIREAAGPDCELVLARTLEEQLERIADAEVVFGMLARDPFLRAKQLQWVQTPGTGADNMLYPEMRESPIPLASNKGQTARQLAEHAFAMLLALTRGVARSIRRGAWSEGQAEGRRGLVELTGLTMGVAGLGGMGREVARRADAFGMRVAALNPSPVPRPPFVKTLWKPDRFPEFLALSDVVTICCPLTPSTRGLFNREAFRQMKPSAYLINVTRGEIVDPEALVEALKEGRIAGAGLDVTSPEPLPAASPLWRMENVVITPHTTGASQYAADRQVARFCENLRRWRRGEPIEGLVDKQKGY